MTVAYSIYAYHPNGVKIGPVRRLRSLDVALTANDRGWLNFIADDTRFIGRDYRFEVWRAAGGQPGKIVGQTQFFCRKPIKQINNRRRLMAYGGPSALDIAYRRIVQAYANSAGSAKTALADNMIKAIITEALANTTWDAARGVSGLLAVAANRSEGASLSKQFAWRKVAEVIREIAEDSYNQGTAIFYDVITDGMGNLTFDTFKGQRGADKRRSIAGANATVLTAEWGQLANVEIQYDFTPEITSVIVGAGGEESARTIRGFASTEKTATPWNTTELFVPATAIKPDDPLLEAKIASEGRSALAANRAATRFQADIVQKRGAMFMDDWDFGDYVTAVADGETYDCRVNAVRVQYAGGKETIQAKIIN